MVIRLYANIDLGFNNHSTIMDIHRVCIISWTTANSIRKIYGSTLDGYVVDIKFYIANFTINFVLYYARRLRPNLHI